MSTPQTLKHVPIGNLIAEALKPYQMRICKLDGERAELIAALKPIASLVTETCSSCDGDGKHGVTDMTCRKCGGIGRIVVGYPDPNDIDKARELLAKLTP